MNEAILPEFSEKEALAQQQVEESRANLEAFEAELTKAE
jgi:hypothetical protein